MDQFNTAVNTFDTSVNRFMSRIDNNEYLSSALTLFLILYAGLAAPKLPEGIARLFDNIFFKVLVLFLIAYTARKEPTVAIVAAVGLMVSLHTLNRIKFFNSVNNMVRAEEGMEAELEAAVAEAEGIPQELAVEEASIMPEAVIPEEALQELQEGPAPLPEEGVEQEGRPNGMAFGQAGCTRTGNFRNSFYPQYVNMKPDSYMARYTGNDVGGYDASARYGKHRGRSTYGSNRRYY